MSSWQSYVDQNLIGTGACKHACIFGLDGSCWATSAGFALSPAEAKALISGFQQPAPLQSGGVNVAGDSYVFLRCVDGRSILAKKSAGGVHCVKTAKAMLVGVYDAPITPGQCSVVVEKLADYLIGVGF